MPHLCLLGPQLLNDNATAALTFFDSRPAHSCLIADWLCCECVGWRRHIQHRAGDAHTRGSRHQTAEVKTVVSNMSRGRRALVIPASLQDGSWPGHSL